MEQGMPTVWKTGPYRVFFYASDHLEPMHVHVERDDKVAKFWLKPVRLQRSGGFSRRELRRINALIEAENESLIEAWNDYFGN